MVVKGSCLPPLWRRLYVQCERRGAILVNNLPNLVTKDPNLQQLKNRPPTHPQCSCQTRNGM